MRGVCGVRLWQFGTGNVFVKISQPLFRQGIQEYRSASLQDSIFGVVAYRRCIRVYLALIGVSNIVKQLVTEETLQFPQRSSVNRGLDLWGEI